MDHALSLLEIERSSRPATYNHYFNTTLQTKRQERMAKTLQPLTVFIKDSKKTYIPFDQIGKQAVNMDNSQQVCEDILDTLESYYKVTRKRFVDILCVHVVFYSLLEGPQSPLKVLSIEKILDLSAEQLEMIAGEDAVSKQKRKILAQELESLKKAVKVLRN